MIKDLRLRQIGSGSLKKWTDFKTLSISSLSLLSKNVFTQNFDKRKGFLKTNTFLCNTDEGRVKTISMF